MLRFIPRRTGLFFYVAFSILTLISFDAVADDVTGTGTGIRLTFKVHTVDQLAAITTVKDGQQVQSAPGQKENDSAVIVTLFPNAMTIKNGQTDTIYDFTTNKLTTLNTEDKTYWQSALYAIPAFRMIEKSNQAKIFNTMAQANVDIPGALKPFDLDMKFGGRFSGKLAEDLKSTQEQGTLKYTYGGEQIAAVSASATAIPAAYKKPYTRFLAHSFTVHQMILDGLKTQPTFLQSFTYINKGVNPVRTTTTYTLDSVADVTDTVPGAIPDGYKPDPQLGEVYARVIKAKAELPPIADSVEEIKGLYDDEDYLDAAIVFLSHAIIYGPQGIDKLRGTIQGIVKDAPPQSRVRDILRLCASQPDKETADKSIREIESIQKMSADYGYLLNSCLAVYYQGIGKVKEAQKLRIVSLLKRPYQVAEIKDLGDGYYLTYDTFRAWTYWDLARQISPSFQTTQKVTEMEPKIVADYPDFF